MKALLITLALLGSGLFQNNLFADQVFNENIGRAYVGQNRIDLLNVTDLDSLEFRRARITRVEVTARTFFGQGTATLLVNGYPVSVPQTIGTDLRPISFFLNPRDNRLNSDIRTLELDLVGGFFLQEVSVYTDEQSRPGNRNYLVKNVNIQTRGIESLQINQIFRRDLRLNDQRPIRQITLHASSARGRGEAQIYINDRPVGRSQIISQRMSEYRFLLPRSERGDSWRNRDRRDRMDRIEIRTRGMINISQIGLRFGRDIWR